MHSCLVRMRENNRGEVEGDTCGDQKKQETKQEASFARIDGWNKSQARQLTSNCAKKKKRGERNAKKGKRRHKP